MFFSSVLIDRLCELYNMLTYPLYLVHIACCMAHMLVSVRPFSKYLSAKY